MAAELINESWPYLRLPADRCQLLSRNCMDLVTARNLRLMSEEYFFSASKMEDGISTLAVPQEP